MSGEQQQKSDLTETEVIIIGCVCAFILISLLIVLIVIVCRRRYRNAKQYQNSTSQPGQVIAHINGNGTAPPKPRRGHDNPGMDLTEGYPVNGRIVGSHGDSSFCYNTRYYSIPDRNGYPAQHTFSHPNGNIPHDTSYDSQLAKYENEMNMRNIDNMKNDPYLSGPRDYSLGGGSPSTPRKDPQQFLDISEDRKDGSVKSGQESGYSTPDGQKPKKVIYEVVV